MQVLLYNGCTAVLVVSDNLSDVMTELIVFLRVTVPAGRPCFRNCPPKVPLLVGRSGPHLIPSWFLGPTKRQTKTQTDHAIYVARLHLMLSIAMLPKK